ncbi:unnamed protein product [Pleuronectes platessa]|uniref:Uncharacterized protein n=1 Tax=Pleuronectes platessa TaxID=8262 RepID=A0A9N7U7Y8_PLEPL|nr:unnamed protein product [Pleuronectes platessa]
MTQLLDTAWLRFSLSSVVPPLGLSLCVSIHRGRPSTPATTQPLPTHLPIYSCRAMSTSRLLPLHTSSGYPAPQLESRSNKSIHKLLSSVSVSEESIPRQSHPLETG